MLRDADLSLASWLESSLPSGTGVRFDAPRARWQEQAADAPFVSAFLCDIRKDGQHQPSSGWSDVRDGDGRLVGRQSPHRYHRLSYLVTAWAGAGAGLGAAVGEREASSASVFEEHDLLGVLINICVSTETLAEDHLRGALAEVGLPVFLRCADDDCGGSPVADPWSGLGIAPRAHLVLELVVPVMPPMARDLAAPVAEVVLGARQLPDSASAVETVRRRDFPGSVSPRPPSRSS
ncbi:hypothetical protein ABH926_005541 [Catenulispora sp. GP43]|uniref:Pvc16 family protein n=1 Tax=Catenulispora sp. GP43 TaxID=3156263 RepID=UPI003514078E